jgi:excisionase family DNA binding protein
MAAGTLYNRVNRGEIPFVKIGRLVRFRLSEIDAWIASGAAAGTSAADQGPQEDVA